MFNLLNQTLAIKKAHGSHRDPKLLGRDLVYVKYGPLRGGGVDMQEKFLDLVIINNWPAFSAVIPESNLGRGEALLIGLTRTDEKISSGTDAMSVTSSTIFEKLSCQEKN